MYNSGNKDSLPAGQRLSKYWFHYVLVVPAFLLIFIFKIIPAISAFILPFKDYKISRGILGGAWVGFENFRKLFENSYFIRVLGNTLTMKFQYIILAAIASLVLALALSMIGNRKLRGVFSYLVLLPYFVPTVVFVYVVLQVVETKGIPGLPLFENPLLQKDVFPLFVTVLDVFKTCGIPALIALGAIMAERKRQGINANFTSGSLFPAFKAILAFSLIQVAMLLENNTELLQTIINPTVYETGDTIGTYQYRTSLLNFDFGLGAAIWLIKFIVQFILSIGAYYLLKHLFVNDLFHRPEDANDENGRTFNASGVAGIILCCLFFVPVLFLVLAIFIRPFFMGSPQSLGPITVPSVSINLAYIEYIIITLVAVVFNALITLTLAYPLTVRNLPGRNFYRLFLVFVLCVGSGSISEYLFFKNLGMINTFMPYFFNGFFSIMNVFVLKSIFNSKYGDVKEHMLQEGKSEGSLFMKLFVPKVLKPLAALCGLQFITMWNSSSVSTIYISNPNMLTPAGLFRQMSVAMQGNLMPFENPVIAKYALLISLPSIIVSILVGRWLTGEVLVSQTKR